MGSLTFLFLALFVCLYVSARSIEADMDPYSDDIDGQDYDDVMAYDDVTDSYDDVTDDIEGTPKCHKGLCRMCRIYRRVLVCIVAKTIPRGMGLTLTAQRQVLVKGDVTNSSSNPICTQHVPKFPDIKSVCLVPSNVSIEQHSACINVTAEFQSRKANVKFGCYTIPSGHDDDQSSEKHSLISILQMLAKNSDVTIIERFTETDDVTLQDDVDADDVIDEDDALRFISE